ncbi:hypothetical protein F6J84_03650 [Microbacterium caowuchunii]|uniref:hypothetical protein n=1 Tax=Microbacterium caowuchunii TaxID=2614638 RepID=UPI001247228D|nr:hypothetical protein [Microbacterium caowuchunii]QEV99299.1 hypothetical protein F6J84_03650 [Microbacterium caowuchunii]
MASAVSFRQLVRQPISTAGAVESSALLVSAPVFVIAWIIAILLFRGGEVAIAGPGSAGQFVALSSFVVSAAGYVSARVLVRRRSAASGVVRARPGGYDAQPRWFDVAALAFAHGIIALLAWLSLASLFERSFIGASLYPFAAAVVSAAGLAVTSYAVFLSAVALAPVQLSLVLVVFLVCGVFASMLTASDPLWWQQNLSALGISDDISARAFNLTLVVAGVIVTTIAHVGTAHRPAGAVREARHRRFLLVGLTLIGVLLACVGIFPVDEFLALHNLSATGTVIVFLALVLGIRRLIPGISHPFALLGYVFAAVIVVLAGCFLTGYYTLTAVELVAFLLVFAWLIVFLRVTGAAASSPRTDAL